MNHAILEPYLCAIAHQRGPIQSVWLAVLFP